MSDDSSDQEDAEQSGQKPVHQKTVRSDAPSASSSSRAPKRKTTEGNISQEEMDEILEKTGAEERGISEEENPYLPCTRTLIIL